MTRSDKNQAKRSERQNMIAKVGLKVIVVEAVVVMIRGRVKATVKVEVGV